MKFYVFVRWMALAIPLILALPADAAPACDPTAPPTSCNRGACLGTEVCDYPTSYCQYSQESNQACSVCGRTGTRFCSEQGNLISGSCSAYAAEVCNNCDDDGDGAVDEGLTGGSCDPQGNGCSGTVTCVAGGWQCLIPSNKTVDCSTQCGAPAHRKCNADGSLGVCTKDIATPEACNGCDDDGDGVADNMVGQGRDTLVTVCEGANGECPGSSKRCVAGAWSTCAAPAEACNGLDDDCDGLFDEGGVCRSDSLACQCQPLTCEQLGANCGPTQDGCGGTLGCGTCPAGQQCGAGGTPNICGCSPMDQTTACAGKDCGLVSNGCGGMLDCGTCAAGQQCGGGGTPNVCGCSPVGQTTACAGKNCGLVSNGCGGSYSCGSSCTGPMSCGGGGTPNVCGCTLKTQAEACGSKQCGVASNGCGQFISCGTCASGTYCQQAVCTSGNGTPDAGSGGEEM